MGARARGPRTARRGRRAAAVAVLAALVMVAGACGGVSRTEDDARAVPSAPVAAGDAEGAVLEAVRLFVEGDPRQRCDASTDRLLAFIYAEGRAGCEAQQTAGEELRGYELVSRGGGRAAAEYTTEVDPDVVIAVGLVRADDRWLVDTYALAEGP